MATWTKTLSSNSNYSISLTVTEDSYSIANNTSNVKYSLTCTKSAGSGYWDNVEANNVKVTINGSTVVNKNISYDFTGSTPKTITLASGTVSDIAHDSNGKKIIACSGYFNMTRNGLGTATASGSLTLTTIPRASTPSIGTVTLGSAITISISRADSSFTHTLSYKFGSASGTIASDVGTSYSWTPALTLANQIPNATSGTGTITCDTYNGSTKIGSKTINFTANVPASVKPTAPTITLTRVDNGVPSDWGVYVKTYSKVTVEASARGSYSSTIKSYSISCDGGGGTGSNGVTLGPFATAGTKTITCTVTDSRGRTNSKTAKFTVVDYSPPSLSVEADRCKSDGTIDSSGTYLKVVATFSYASVSSKNSITSKSASCNGVSNTSFSSGVAFILAANADIGKSYILTASVTDALGNSSSPAEITILTASRIINVNEAGDGIAFGKFSEKAGFECGMDAEFLLATLFSGEAVFAQGIRSKFLNTITTPDDDTCENWRVYKNSVHYFNTAGQLTDQPTTYGLVLSMVYDNNISQLWFEQGSGNIYRRSGNATGWIGTWRRLMYADENADSGWITPTIGSKFVSYSTAWTPRYRKIGKMVEINGAVKPASAIAGSTTSYTIFTLPTGYRPSKQISVTAQGSATNTWLCEVKTTGIVSFSRYNNGAGYVSCPTDAWLPFHVTFYID